MKKIVIGLVIAMCLALLTVAGSSLGETWSGTETISQGESFNITLPDLTKGEELKWNWYTQAFRLDYEIENETDYVMYDVYSASSDTNGTTIPEDGTYEIIWENNLPAGTGQYGVTFNYTIEVINHDPTASPGSNETSGKEPLYVSFTGDGNDVDGTIEDYDWDFGDGTTSPHRNPDHVFDNADTYTVTLTVTDNDGNTGSETLTITVDPNPPPTAVAAANVSGGEPPLSVSFDGSDSEDDPEGYIVSYHWVFDDGDTSDEMNPTHTFDAEGVYDVVLTVTDNQDATGTDNVTITVSIENLDPTASASADATTVTEGATVTFTDASTDADGTIASWAWDFGDGTTSTDQNPTHAYDTAGTYTAVLVVADDDGATDTVSITITVLTDTDGDGHDDEHDAFPNNAAEWEDTDDDGIGDNADPDDDNDGMSDDWENIYGLNPKVDDADDDADGDGYSNKDEFEAGTNPIDVGDRPTGAKEDELEAGTFIIIVVIIILVVILLLFLMRKGAGKPKGIPPEEPVEEMGEEEPVEEYGEEPVEEAEMMEGETYEEPTEEYEEDFEEPSEETYEESGEEMPEETSDEELDNLLEDTDEEKPEY